MQLPHPISLMKNGDHIHCIHPEMPFAYRVLVTCSWSHPLSQHFPLIASPSPTLALHLTLSTMIVNHSIHRFCSIHHSRIRQALIPSRLNVTLHVTFIIILSLADLNPFLTRNANHIILFTKGIRFQTLRWKAECPPTRPHVFGLEPLAFVLGFGFLVQGGPSTLENCQVLQVPTPLFW